MAKVVLSRAAQDLPAPCIEKGFPINNKNAFQRRVAVMPILFFRIQLVVCDLGLRMRAVIVAPIRLPGDGLARCLHGRADVEILRVVTNIAGARALLSTAHVVSREATTEGLTNAMLSAVAGRLACPDEISGGLLPALFRQEPEDS